MKATLFPWEKVRGRKKSLNALVDHMEKSAIPPVADQMVFITHGDCLEDAEYVANKVRERFGVRDVVINYVDPVIEALCVPARWALFYGGKSQLAIMSAPAMPATTRRTLHYYWQVTRSSLFAGLVVSTLAYVALLSYANPYLMSMVVDQVSANPVAADEVFSTFGPFALALVAVNVFGQVASKLQDYCMYRLQIAASYDLATMSFGALCNQSMSFHSNRFGGTLVSQTSKFMSAYQLLLETLSFPFAGALLGRVYLRCADSARACLRCRPDGAARDIRLRVLLYV